MRSIRNRLKILLCWSLSACLAASCAFSKTSPQSPQTSLQTSPSTASAQEDLANLLNNMQTLQADFTQLVSDSNGHIIQRTKGQLALQRPGKFYWQTNQPSKQIIIANQAKLWVYDVDLEQVTVQRLSKAIGAAPALLLSRDRDHLQQDFNVTRLNTASNTERWFKLIPKSTADGLQALRLCFVAGQLQEMQFNDNLEHKNLIQLQKVRLNQPVEPSLFILHVPKNVDIINNEQE